MVGLVPSILSADFTRLGEQVREAEAAGAQRIQVDVMDGHFVPNITMGPMVVEAVRRCTGLPLEAHPPEPRYSPDQNSRENGWRSPESFNARLHARRHTLLPRPGVDYDYKSWLWRPGIHTRDTAQNCTCAPDDCPAEFAL